MGLKIYCPIRLGPSINQITPKVEGVSRASWKLDMIKEAYNSKLENEELERERYPCLKVILAIGSYFSLM